MIIFVGFFSPPSQFQRTFESLRNVSSKSDLQKTYQKFQKDLENLDYLAYKRQQVRPWKLVRRQNAGHHQWVVELLCLMELLFCHLGFVLCAMPGKAAAGARST